MALDKRFIHSGSTEYSRPILEHYGLLRVSTTTPYLAQGWIIGAEGFSPANSLPTLSGIVLILVWSVWLLVSASFGKDVPLRDRAEG